MGEVHACPTRMDRFRGCLLAGAAGDALGAAVEFMSTAQIDARFGAGGIRDYVRCYGRIGAITDDTQMTLFTAEGLLRCYVRWLRRGIAPPAETMIARSYGRWLLTQGDEWRGPRCYPESSWLYSLPELHARRAPGNTCLSALAAIDDPRDPPMVASNDSKGCGGVMRMAPVGLFFAASTQDGADVERAFDLGCKTAAITHGHPAGQYSAGALAALVAQLCSGRTLHASIGVARELLVVRPDHRETLAALDDAIALAGTDVPGPAAIARLGEGWVAEEALAIALYAALKAPTLEEGVIMAVNHGGDSDSTGAIAGSLLGAMLGSGAIPARWLEPLELRDAIETVADDLASAHGWSPEDDGLSSDARMARYPGY